MVDAGRTDAPDTPRPRRFGSATALKAIVTVTALCLIALSVNVHDVAGKLAALDPARLGLIAGLLAAQIVVAAWRWHRILLQLGVRARFRDDFHVFVAGALANTLLLSSIGGLAVRSALLVRRGVPLSTAATGLAIERILILAAIAASLVPGTFFIGKQVTHPALAPSLHTLVWGGLAVIAVLATAGLFLARHPLATAVLQVAKRFWAQPLASLGLFAHSLFVLYAGFAVVGVLALTLKVDVPLLPLLAIQPVIALVASLPVSIGGWGVREGSMVVSLGALGVGREDALAVAVLYGVAGVVVTVGVAVMTRTFEAFASSRTAQTAGR